MMDAETEASLREIIAYLHEVPVELALLTSHSFAYRYGRMLGVAGVVERMLLKVIRDGQARGPDPALWGDD